MKKSLRYLFIGLSLATTAPSFCMGVQKTTFSTNTKSRAREFLKAISPKTYRSFRKITEEAKPFKNDPLTEEQQIKQQEAQEMSQKIWNDLHWLPSNGFIGKLLCKINPNRTCPTVALCNLDEDYGQYHRGGNLLLPKNWTTDDTENPTHELAHAWQYSAYHRYIYNAFLYFFKSPEANRFYTEYEADKKMMEQLYKKRNYDRLFHKIIGHMVEPQKQHALHSPYLYGRLDTFFRLLAKKTQDETLQQVLQAAENALTCFNNPEFIKEKVKARVYQEETTDKELEQAVEQYLKEINPTPMLTVQEFKNWKPKNRNQRYKEHLEKYKDVFDGAAAQNIESSGS